MLNPNNGKLLMFISATTQRGHALRRGREGGEEREGGWGKGEGRESGGGGGREGKERGRGRKEVNPQIKSDAY